MSLIESLIAGKTPFSWYEISILAMVIPMQRSWCDQKAVNLGRMRLKNYIYKNTKHPFHLLTSKCSPLVRSPNPACKLKRAALHQTGQPHQAVNHRMKGNNDDHHQEEVESFVCHLLCSNDTINYQKLDRVVSTCILGPPCPPCNIYIYVYI